MGQTATLPPQVRALDDASVLEAVAACRREADRAEAELLALAVHYVDLHPVTDSTIDHALDSTIGQSIGHPTGPSGPLVAEHAVEALGAALGISYRAASGLVTEAVELCWRLPRLWELVQGGALQSWKARLVARETPRLSAAAVDFVDRHSAVLGRRNRMPGNLAHLVHEALLRCDPDTATGVEEALLAHRDVVFDHRAGTATTQLTATLDTLDALDLDGTLCDLATSMGRLGDTSPVGVRRAHALGMLANPQRTLALFGQQHPGTPGEAGPPAPDTAWHTSRATLYLHVDAADLRAHADTDTDTDTDGRTGAGTGGRVEKLGPATLDLLHGWLDRTGHLSIRPVLDLDRTDAVDTHDPPHWMRESVILRDGQCVFPGCPIDARSCDLDHIEPYQHPDHGGPPGQTTPANLACLCRRHHRLKTFTPWTYHRTLTGHYRWTSPHGDRYLTAPTPRR
jgi:hypothetical protein